MFKVDLKDMGKWNVTYDNVRWYNHIMTNKGRISALDYRPYVEWLNEFDINFETTDVNIIKFLKNELNRKLEV